MVNYKGIIINGFEHLNPLYRISPFKKEYISKNKKIYQSESSRKIYDFFNERFPSKDVYLTADGRSAIGYAVDALGLKTNDCVTIITTTNNFYISSCVTSEIEKRCKWSREINLNTKAILINHEFGLFNRSVEKYKKLGIPIIEDFAHSFFSLNEAALSGVHGEFLICSFSKIFPMQAGGALLVDKSYNSFQVDSGDNEILHYVDSNASFYIEDLMDIKNKRLENYKIFVKKFQSIGVDPFFDFLPRDVPSVFCFNIQENINASDFKKFMNSNGIESSVFYGSNAYFIPCHQNIDEDDIEYMFEVSRFYLEK